MMMMYSPCLLVPLLAATYIRVLNPDPRGQHGRARCDTYEYSACMTGVGQAAARKPPGLSPSPSSSSLSSLLTTIVVEWN